jgi:hypothetical protein
MTTSPRRFAVFIPTTLALVAALLTAIALLNWWVDPFQQYRLAAAEQVRYVRALQRYINPGLAKNAEYDFVISGSSLMENYDLAQVNQSCRAQSINLATSAISAFEQRQILETALRHRNPRRVLMTLDFNSFAPAIDASLPEIVDPLPLHLYDDNRLNDFRYLLSGPITMRSLAALAKVPIGTYSTDPRRAWSWEHEVGFSREQMLKGIDSNDINRRFKQAPRNLERMRASFDFNIAAIIENHPETEFNIVFPPYSIVVWLDFAQREQLELSLQFKEHVLARLRDLPNARIFDMQWDDSITHNLDLYADIYHFSPEVSRRLLESVCSDDDRYRVTAATLDAFNARIREQASAFTLSTPTNNQP